MTRFDDEINDLDEVIKQKEKAISDIELSIKKAEHDLQSLQKNRTAAVNAMTTLEKAYEWIAQEKKCVLKSFSSGRLTNYPDISGRRELHMTSRI